MLDKPDLPDESLIARLREQYALQVEKVQFLPLGNAAATWAYRVATAAGERYFLKLKHGPFDPAALRVPHFLQHSGLTYIVAPLPTQSGTLLATLGDYTLILMPYIAGQTGMTQGLSDSQWREYGAILRAIHQCQPSPELKADLPQESFVPPWSPTLRELQREIEAANYSDPLSQALATLWRDKADEIMRLVERCEALGRQWRAQSPPLLLCHSDIHTDNLIIDAQGQLHVVDWDSPRRAPKERDLMFIVGSDQTDEREIALFFEGYGDTEVDTLGISYYRYEWVLQELADYAERLLWADLGEASRHAGLQEFRKLFDPGNVVEAAYQSDETFSAG